MENRYWIARKRRAMTMARSAVSAEARLIHYDLAGRYSVMAAQTAVISAAAPRAERPLLHLRTPCATLDEGEPGALPALEAGRGREYGERS